MTAADLGHKPDTLAALSVEELKGRWLQLRGTPVPKFLRRELMTRAVAYAMQEDTLVASIR